MKSNHGECERSNQQLIT
uniref:Uncharacterized protein n=1 Tax=Anguilla anguilla TaxID=7936 RepID=A0A0E9VC97_ANGAN